MKKILILGASGRTGRLILDYALRKGYKVNALVRNPDKIQPREGLTLFKGTPENPEDIDHAMEGTQGVLVALNNVRTSDFPWAKQVSPPRFMANAVKGTVIAMEKRGLRRIVIISALGVGDSFSTAPILLRWLEKYTNVGKTYDDHNWVDQEIRDTDTDWTLVRAVGLSNSDKSKTLQVTEVGGPKPALIISRMNVAKFAVDALENDAYIHKAPIIYEK
ncbi:NAD(P)H-binding protein [Paenibacillus sp. FSL H3-0469]|uniref:NAD(P)-dependent oxidoreductase n=1 Tax=Paenibacillus sp. FSL H3-0469 TaxID=2954506 RepID=UPI0031011EF3